MRHAAYTSFAVLAAAVSGCGGTNSAVDGTTSSTKVNRLLPEHVYRVPSGSMEPTLGPGARVIVSPGRPRVGEIIVFHPPEDAEMEECGPTPHAITSGGAACANPVPRPSTVRFIKRVVAGPGDELYLREGNVYRRAAGSGGFVRQPDPYIRPCRSRPECSFPTPITVPAGHWYLLGDNRGESDDSRFYGAVPTSWIIGVVTACAPPRGSGRTLGQLMSIRACRLPRTHG